jgi:hypothetical protein
MRFVILIFLVIAAAGDPPPYSNINEAPHFYLQRTLSDPFTRLKGEIESGAVALDQSSPKAFLKSLLEALKVPEESQVLVFSTTSLQLSLISPSNPRAIYFNEDVYVGFIPGGKIEILSLDPELGGIFYIFPIPRMGEKLQPERSGRCMNCHSTADSRYIPGLVLQSVVPAPSGGSLDAFRKEETGHQVPYEQRFGGWYVTGQGSMTNHWANLIGRMRDGEVTKQMIEPGQRFDFGKYLVPHSDLLAHLLLEHQAGFVNRVLEAAYRTRYLLHVSGGQLNVAQNRELDAQARDLVRYILFADEPPLPSEGLKGEPTFKTAFLRNRRPASNGGSLKDFDLRQRLFKNRCSYMIYSPLFTALPPEIKRRVLRELASALRENDKAYSHLASEEKERIRTILKDTSGEQMHAEMREWLEGSTEKDKSSSP